MQRFFEARRRSGRVPVAKAALLLLLAALFTPFAVLRPGEDAEEVLKNVEKKYATIKDAKITFSQDVKFGVTGTEQSFTGTLAMKKGNKYRIELEDQTIVTDGVAVWSYTKSTKQVIIDKYKENPQSFSPDRVLVNVPDHYRSIVLAEEKVNGRDASVLKLTPVDPKSNIQWMKIWVGHDDWMMKKVQVLEVSDNLTTYGIDSMRTNIGLGDDQFTFDAPQGVEVIDLR